MAELSAPLVITVHGTPAPQGSKRHVGNGRMVESSARVQPWREAVKEAALKARAEAGNPPPLTGPLHVEMVFYIRRPKGHYRTGRNAHLLRDSAPRYPAQVPDLSIAGQGHRGRADGRRGMGRRRPGRHLRAARQAVGHHRPAARRRHPHTADRPLMPPQSLTNEGIK